jgi:cardiolipin synthase A/B
VRTVKWIALFSAAAVAVLICAAAATGSLSGAVSRPASKPRPAAEHAAALTLLSEPAAGIGPFLNLISHAQHSVELTMYELHDRRVESALAAAAHRGVDVRVLLNGGYYGDDEFKGADRNGPAYAYLRAHRVQVRWTPGYFALTHQKTLTVDGRLSAVMTLNFVGDYASTRDFAVLDHQAPDVRAIVAAFNADWNAHKLIPSDGGGDLIWSPDAAGAFESMIKSARRSLDVENEEMDYSPITSDLCAAARRGVAVHVVMTYASDWASAFDRLRGCGVRLHRFHGQSYYIHAKVLIADGQRAIISSQNFSYTSLYENRELGIRLTSASVLRPLISDFDGDYKRG